MVQQELAMICFNSLGPNQLWYQHDFNRKRILQMNGCWHLLARIIKSKYWEKGEGFLNTTCREYAPYSLMRIKVNLKLIQFSFYCLQSLRNIIGNYRLLELHIRLLWVKTQNEVHQVKRSLGRPCVITNDVLKVKKRTQEEKETLRRRKELGKS